MHISPEDRDLVNGCAANKRSSQETLYRKYFNIACRMCHRYTYEEEAIITIVNNAFLTIFKKVDQYKETGSFEGWIKRIVFNALSDYFKKENRRQKFIEIGHSEGVVDNSGLSELYLADLSLLIKQLPKATQEVFLLYAVEGYNHREIGEILNIAEGTSKWHLSHARSMLQEKIKLNTNVNHG